MTSLFLHFLNLSVTAGWMVLVVLLLRLCLKKAPRWITCVLWGLVALRLVVPFTIESPVSLIPTAQTVTTTDTDTSAPMVNSGMESLDKPLNNWLQTPVKPQETPHVQSPLPPATDTNTVPQPTPDKPAGDTDTTPQPPAEDTPDTPEQAPVDTETKSVSRMERILQIAAPVWLVGIGLMLLYELISVLRVRFRVLDAVRLCDNVWQSDRVASPFIFGLFRPRIYVPYGLEEPVLEQVLSHERAHLHRRDHWIKPFAFTLLAVYWYNPLLWVGYILLCRDIEVACDERVIRSFDEDNRRRYATALLQCGVERRSIAACPLAFGEVSIKQRIKSVLNYRKPLLWVIVASLVICAVAAVCLLTVPASEPKDTNSNEDNLIVLNSLTVKPAKDHCFYGSDVDGAIPEGGLDWLWAHAANADDRPQKNSIPLVISHSTSDLNEMVAGLSDSKLDISMLDWFALEKYDTDYFKEKALLWLFVSYDETGYYEYTVTLEETNKGARYVVNPETYGTSMFVGVPRLCQYLMYFEVPRESVEQTDSFMTLFGTPHLEVPTEGIFLSLGDVDLDGDGVKESLQLHHDGIALDTTELLAFTADGKPILNETVLNHYNSQCYLVPHKDGGTQILFVGAYKYDYEYVMEEFGVLSLKDGIRTCKTLDTFYTGNNAVSFDKLIPYVETLSAYLEDAVLLYETENGSLYYGDELDPMSRYTPLSWLDAYRESDDDTLQDVMGNLLAYYNTETLATVEMDLDEDGEKESLSVLRYSIINTYRISLLVRKADGTILTGFDIQNYYAETDLNPSIFFFLIKDEAGKETLKIVRPLDNRKYFVDDVTLDGMVDCPTMTLSEWTEYVEESDAQLLFYVQELELYFPGFDDTESVYLPIDATKYTVANYNESIIAYNAFLKGQRVAYEFGDFDTMLYVTDMYTTVLKKGINRYALADVTDDGVPELITGGYTMSVFTYQSGRVLRLYESRAGAFPTLLSNGCLWEERTGAGEFYWYTKFFAVGTTHTIDFDIGYFTSGNRYNVDGVEMNKADFDAKTATYFANAQSPALLLWYDYTTKQPASQAMVQYLSLLNNAYYGADVFYALYDADLDGKSELLIKKQDDVIIGLPRANPTITNVAESISWVSMVEKPLHLLDVTADGYSDVLVEFAESAYGKKIAFLRWDVTEERLVMISTIVSNPSFDSETAVIRSEYHGDQIVSYGVYKYDADVQDLVRTHSLYFEENEQATGDSDRMKLVVNENGVTKTLYVRGEPYALDKTDPQVAPYYAPDSFWNLDSLQWENYVAQYVSDYVHILQRNHSEADAQYAIHDMDGDGMRELLVLEGTKLTVYARTEQAGMIRVLVEQDFQTATSRFLLTGDDKYPGLIYVSIGGGKEWYYYLSLDQVQNGAFVLAPLWTDNYAEFGVDEDGRITELSDDAQLIAVSRHATSVPFVSYDL